MCIVTRKICDEAELVRFVRSPDGIATPDLQRKLPGRGVWVSLDQQALAEAVKRNLFSRGFGEPTQMPDGLTATVSKLLHQQALSILSLARKAGEALASAMKVEEALRRGPVTVLLHVEGAAADGVRRLNRLAHPETVIFGHFRADELDLAFGRTNVVHAAVASGGLADKMVFHMRRMAAYDGLDFQNRIGSEN